MKANIPPFQIGDKVVYIKYEYFENGSTHEVTSVKQAQCGCWEVYVDSRAWGKNNLFNKNVTCKQCKKYFLSNESIIGYFASDFRLSKEQTAPLMTFEAIKEIEKEQILI